MTVLTALTVKERLVLIGIVLVGSYLRFANLGDVGFRWDEDLSGLTVQAILNKGVPELPSGLMYWRGVLSSYMMAASAQWFGFSEFSLRFPSVVFGIATIPLVFVVFARLFDSKVGLLVAGLFALSYWDIEMGRYARMYAAFNFFYLLTLYAIWRLWLERRSALGVAVCVMLALLTISLHRLGYTLVLFFLVTPFFRSDTFGWPKPNDWGQALVATGITGGFFLYWKQIIDANYAAFALPILFENGQTPAELGFLERLLRLVLNEINPPELTLYLSLWEQSGAVVIGLGVLLLGVATGAALRFRFDTTSILLLMLLVAACALHLFNVALLLVFLIAFSRLDGLRGFQSMPTLTGIGILILAFVAWLVLGLGLDLGGHAAEGTVVAVRRTIKSLLDFPRFPAFWAFPKEWPWLAPVAGLGFLWLFDKAARRVFDRQALFILLVVLIPTAANGFFKMPYDLYRYSTPLDPFYFSLVALGLLGWSSLWRVWFGREAGQTFRRVGSFALVVLVLLVDMNPLRSWMAAHPEHRRDAPIERLFRLRGFPDFRTTAEFVADNRRPGETVLVLDSREVYNYLGGVDFWVRAAVFEFQSYLDGDTIRDKYVDTPLLMSLEELRAVLGKPGRKWLVASDRMIRTTQGLDEPLREFLLAQDHLIVYEGLDRSTGVYLFTAGPDGDEG